MNGFEMILPFLKPIEHLILDDSISEVMVNGPDRVFIEKGGLLQQVPGVSLGDKSLMVAVKNIARRLGDDISESKPILDSRLPDGSRVAAVIPPCSLSGVTLTIRKKGAQMVRQKPQTRMATRRCMPSSRISCVSGGRSRLMSPRGTLCFRRCGRKAAFPSPPPSSLPTI